MARYQWLTVRSSVAQPAVLSSTVGRGLVHRAQEANPITVDDNNNTVIDVPAPVRRAVIEARAITIAAFLVLLGLITVPYVVFKRTVSCTLQASSQSGNVMLTTRPSPLKGHKKLGLLLQSFNQQPTGPSRDPASRLAWQLSKPDRSPILLSNVITDYGTLVRPQRRSRCTANRPFCRLPSR